VSPAPIAESIATIRALFVSASTVVCETEALASNSARSVQLSLQLSGRSTLDTLTYHFLVTVVIDTAHPMVGPVHGGTTVVIDGNVRTRTSKLDANLH
jgi:hypothetical protein